MTVENGGENGWPKPISLYPRGEQTTSAAAFDTTAHFSVHLTAVQ